jgi:type II secretory pathway component PulK
MSSRKRGFALIFILVQVAVIMSVVSEVLYQTQMGAHITLGQQDLMNAEFCAETGMGFARLLLELKSSLEDLPPEQAAMAQALGDPLTLLNGIPIGSPDALTNLVESEEAMKTFLGGEKLLSSSMAKVFKSIPGVFVITSGTENRKININLLQSTYSRDTKEALLRLFSTPLERDFLEAKGYTPEQLVANMVSYIKISTTDGDDVSTSAYESIGAKYPPKHAALESLEELRRIPGFHDDDIYNMFVDYFTIWPISGEENGLNFNEAPTELLAGLLTKVGNTPKEQMWDDFENKRNKSEKFKEQRDITDWLQKQQQLTESENATEPKLNKILGTKSKIYKLEVRGISRKVERTLTIVFEKLEKTGQNQPSGKRFKVLYSRWS